MLSNESFNVGIKQEVERDFHETIDIALQDKLLELSEAVLDDFISEQSNSTAYGCTHLDAINGNSYDGFIARQRGGFEVTEYYNTHAYEGLTKKNQRFLDGMQDGLYQSFNQTHNQPHDYTYDDYTDELQQELEEWECDYYEPALLRFEVWCEDYSATVFFRLSLGYKDAPYYRTKYDDTLIEFTLTNEDVMQLTSEELIKRLAFTYTTVVKED